MSNLKTRLEKLEHKRMDEEPPPPIPVFILPRDEGPHAEWEKINPGGRCVLIVRTCMGCTENPKDCNNYGKKSSCKFTTEANTATIEPAR